jgi:hypothetical protein
MAKARALVDREKLAEAQMMDWRYNTIWFDQIDANKVATIDCQQEPAPNNFGDLEYITIWRYKQRNQS